MDGALVDDADPLCMRDLLVDVVLVASSKRGSAHYFEFYLYLLFLSSSNL